MCVAGLAALLHSSLLWKLELLVRREFVAVFQFKYFSQPLNGCGKTRRAIIIIRNAENEKDVKIDGSKLLYATQ